MTPDPSKSYARVRSWAVGAREQAERHWPALLVIAAAFALYAYFRARHVAGCDTWTYLSQARLLRGLDVGVDLEGAWDPVRYRALVPLCYELAERNLVPAMPPGYSAELALGGLFGLEFFVSPAVGALTALLFYLSAERYAGRIAATLLTLLWVTSPIVIWASVSLMGDLSAACALLLAHVLLETKRTRGAGFVLGASMGIRPTNLLFVGSVLARKNPRAELWAFAVAAAAGLFGWALFGLGRYGPSMFGMYGDNAHAITYERVGEQLRFFGSMTFAVFPLILPLALVGALVGPPTRTPLVIWVLGIVLFYAGWRWPYTRWWWLRHVIPAYPALALLAAHGVATVRARLPFAPRQVALVGLVAALGNVVWALHFSWSHGLFTRRADATFEEDSIKIRKLVPQNSLIGGVNFSGPLRLYGHLESFRWDDPGAPMLIDDALAAGRPVYLLIEPRLFGVHPAALALRERYSLRAETPLGYGYVLRRVRVKRPERGK